MIGPLNHLSSTEQWHGGLYEVHLPVTDLGRAIDFYVGKLGFEVGFGARADSSVLLLYTAGERRWMLGLFCVDKILHRHVAEYHIAFRVPEEEADQMIASLAERGIEPIHPPDAPIQGRMTEPIVHGWMPAAAVFFRDPDGHLIELIAELSAPPRPELSYLPLSEWRRLTGGDA